MLPISNSTNSDLKKPKTPPDLPSSSPSSSSSSLDIVIFKTYFLTPLSRHPRCCLILSLLFLQLFILSFSHSFPTLSFSHPPPPRRPSSLISSSSSPLKTYSSFSSPETDPDPDPDPPTPAPNPEITHKQCDNNITNDDNCGSPLNQVSKAVADNQCEYGKFYLYQLPPEFNAEIIENCDKLSPWGSRCGALSNGGFGQKALGIEQIIPGNLGDAWYWTDQFAAEIIFHQRMMHHKCRTQEAELASAYYIPFYAGLAVGKYLWDGYGYTSKDRDQHCEKMLAWIQGMMPYFNRSLGWDHFLVMGRITWDFRRTKDQDWGSRCILMPGMRNITRLLIERNHWDYFDVGVPYPTGFHPETPSEVVSWQKFVLSRERRTLFCFAGGPRHEYPNDFRGLLLDQCRESGGSCKAVDCSGTRCVNGTSEILQTFLDSEFCLQPRGDSFTRRSIFDCMLAGSIPVFFWKRSAYLQYQWFLPPDPKSYSVFIHRDEVKNGTSIQNLLQRFSKQEVQMMRHKVVEFIPNFIYAKPNQGLPSMKDAVDLAVDGVLSRIKDQNEKGYRW